MKPSSSSSVSSPAAAVPAGSRWPALEFSDAALAAAKWSALVLMLVDHANKYLLAESQPWMFALGRLSMPLFAFVLGYNLARPGMLAQGGYRRTAWRLALFGALATPPFLAITPLVSGWWPLNIMVTFLVAVVGIGLLDRGGLWPTMAACIVLGWGGAVGEYWWPAIGLCMTVWAYRRQPSGAMAAAFVICLAAAWVVNGNLWALAAVPLLAALHRWPRGWSVPRAQWFYYGLYPAHFALLWWWLRSAGAG